MGNLGGSNKVLTLHQAAELLNVPPDRLRRYWRSWGIKPYKVGKELRFLERNLWAWLESREVL
jgi:excisionase family DNA binding protein